MLWCILLLLIYIYLCKMIFYWFVVLCAEFWRSRVFAYSRFSLSCVVLLFLVVFLCFLVDCLIVVGFFLWVYFVVVLCFFVVVWCCFCVDFFLCLIWFFINEFDFFLCCCVFVVLLCVCVFVCDVCVCVLFVCVVCDVFGVCMVLCWGDFVLEIVVCGVIMLWVMFVDDEIVFVDDVWWKCVCVSV